MALSKQLLQEYLDDKEDPVLAWTTLACGYLLVKKITLIDIYAVIEIYESGTIVDVHGLFATKLEAEMRANRLLEDEEQVSDILHDRLRIQ